MPLDPHGGGRRGWLDYWEPAPPRLPEPLPPTFAYPEPALEREQGRAPSFGYRPPPPAPAPTGPPRQWVPYRETPPRAFDEGLEIPWWPWYYEDWKQQQLQGWMGDVWPPPDFARGGRLPELEYQPDRRYYLPRYWGGEWAQQYPEWYFPPWRMPGHVEWWPPVMRGM